MNNYAKPNWNEYDKNLENGGSINFWLNNECLERCINRNTKPRIEAFLEKLF